MKQKRFASIPCKIDIQQDQIEDLLKVAVEGGSDHWAYFQSVEAELFDAGIIIKIFDLQNDQAFKPISLDRNMLVKGLHLFAEKHPDHFLKWALDKNYDEVIGDLFLQITCFGEKTFSKACNLQKEIS